MATMLAQCRRVGLSRVYAVSVLLTAALIALLASRAEARRSPDSLSRYDAIEQVAKAFEKDRDCRWVRLLWWAGYPCANPLRGIEAPSDAALLEDLIGLAWGDPGLPSASDRGLVRAGQALRCQWAIADAIRRGLEGAEPRDRERPWPGRKPARGPSDARLSRSCRVDVAVTRAGTVLPRVGRQCSAAIGPPGTRVDADALAACLARLVETWRLRALGQATSRPNIIVIVADDQRADTIGFEHPRDGGQTPAMPAVMDRLAAEGITFRNAYVTNPVCGPSRAGLLTAQFADRNGVYHNTGIHGSGFFDDASTLATWLSDAGYRTGFYGKYMNEYTVRWNAALGLPLVPPGWSDFRAFNASASVPHSGFSMVENGSVVRYSQADYATDVLSGQVATFVSTAVAEGEPFFAYVNTSTPHYPWTAAPRHQDAFDDLPLFVPPNFYEADVSDKPAWVQARPGLTFVALLGSQSLRRAQLAMQLSVDEMVDTLMTQLDALGVSDETIVVYTSDNGHAWGEHRWVSKGCPWEECARIPLLVRYPPLAPLGRVEDGLVSLVDLAVTLAELAGADVPAARQGTSFVRSLDATERSPRQDVFIESYSAATGSWVAIRDARFKFVEYRNGELELYDLERDPFELENLSALADQAERVHAMTRHLREVWPGWDTVP